MLEVAAEHNEQGHELNEREWLAVDALAAAAERECRSLTLFSSNIFAHRKDFFSRLGQIVGLKGANGLGGLPGLLHRRRVLSEFHFTLAAA